MRSWVQMMADTGAAFVSMGFTRYYCETQLHSARSLLQVVLHFNNLYLDSKKSDVNENDCTRLKLNSSLTPYSPPSPVA